TLRLNHSRRNALRRPAARINAFAESIALLFDHADAPATDIHAALLRADVFVPEPYAFEQPVANLVSVILVTNSVETVDPETKQLKASVELALVHGDRIVARRRN